MIDMDELDVKVRLDMAAGLRAIAAEADEGTALGEMERVVCAAWGCPAGLPNMLDALAQAVAPEGMADLLEENERLWRECEALAKEGEGE